MKLKKSELKNQVFTALNLTTSKQVASWAKQNNLSVDLCYTTHWELVLQKINEFSNKVLKEGYKVTAFHTPYIKQQKLTILGSKAQVDLELKHLGFKETDIASATYTPMTLEEVAAYEAEIEAAWDNY